MPKTAVSPTSFERPSPLGRPVYSQASRLIVAHGVYILVVVRGSDDVAAYAQDFQNALMVVVACVAVVLMGIGAGVLRGMLGPLTQALRLAEDVPAGRHRSEAEVIEQLVAIAKRQSEVPAEHSGSTVVNAVLGAMNEGLVAIDSEGHVVFLNGSAQELLEIDEDRMDHARELWQLTPNQQVVDVFDQVLKKREDVTLDITHREAAGDMYLKIHATPFAYGGQSGAVMVISDMTNLRRMEIIRRDFVTNVSHELKTPLTVVRGVLETLLDDPDMPLSMRNNFISKAEQQSTRLSALITDLITLSQQEGTRSDFQNVDVYHPVSDAVRSQNSYAESNQLPYTVRLNMRL